LVGGPVAHGADVVASSRLREGDDGARLEGVEGAARAVDHVEQVLVLRALMPGAVEHRLGGGGDRGEKEADVAQQLCERGGAPGVERSQELLGSGILRRGCCGWGLRNVPHPSLHATDVNTCTSIVAHVTSCD